MVFAMREGIKGGVPSFSLERASSRLSLSRRRLPHGGFFRRAGAAGRVVAAVAGATALDAAGAPAGAATLGAAGAGRVDAAARATARVRAVDTARLARLAARRGPLLALDSVSVAAAGRRSRGGRGRVGVGRVESSRDRAAPRPTTFAANIGNNSERFFSRVCRRRGVRGCCSRVYVIVECSSRERRV